jgi:hypothetical protein
MDEVAPCDRPKLPGREESRDGNIAESSLHRSDVVVRLAEKSLTAAVA